MVLGVASLATCGIVASLIGGVAGMQPEATLPKPAPMRNITWGKLNILQTTDTHGWLAGHLHEPQYSADWGDYISFVHHMQQEADRRGVDLLVIDTGDRIEGNGLYEGTTPKGGFLYDIYRQLEVDLLTTGNHELYLMEAVDNEYNIMVPNFKNNYIASNTNYRMVNGSDLKNDRGELVPMAPRYRKFETKHQKAEIVAFGFIFNFPKANKTNSYVQYVEATIMEPWFQEAMQENPDLFIVTGHIGLAMSEFKDTIYHAIRKHHPRTPIMFLGGHVHQRDARLYDDRAFGIAGGRYFETVGWVSINWPDAPSLRLRDAEKLTFTRRYIDTNLLSFYHHTGLSGEAFETERGKNTTQMITNARKAMDLEKLYGCAPKTYWMERAPYGHEDNVHTLLTNTIVPEIIVNPERADIPHVILFNSGAIRFDIFKGRFTRDSALIATPFSNVFKYLPDVPYRLAKAVYDILADWETHFPGKKRPYIMFTGISECVQQALQESPVSPETMASLAKRYHGQVPLNGDGEHEGSELTEGYTTSDDFGDDGDDTVHRGFDTYPTPPMMQSRIGIPENEELEVVDVVFIDFLWEVVIEALNKAKYDRIESGLPRLSYNTSGLNEDNIKLYGDGRFDQMLTSWVSKHWPC